MKLKCFGGPRDGEMIDIEHAQASIGNRIHAPLSPGILKWMEKWAASKVLFEFASPVYGFYIVDFVRLREGWWRFLRYEHLRSEQVFSSIFGSSAKMTTQDDDEIHRPVSERERASMLGARERALEVERHSIASGVRKYEG